MPRPGYIYSASDYGPKEEKLRRDFFLQRDDARNYFLSIIKPRLDRSYKLYIAYGGDRQREIKKWQCVSSDTEILSASGWKKMGEVKQGDDVFSFDVETGKILPDIVRATHVYEVDSEMISIKCEGTDQLITTNHRVLCKEGIRPYINRKKVSTFKPDYEYIEAEKLGPISKSYRIPTSGFFDGTVSIGGDIAELIGWFITDGCLPKSGPLYITQSKPSGVLRLRSLLISSGVIFREWSRPKGDGNYDEHRFYIDNKSVIGSTILNFAPGRKPSTLLWQLTLDEKMRVLDGVFSGDGSRRPDGKTHMVHKPYNDFKDWLQGMLHLSGLRGYVKEKYVNVAHSDTIDVKTGLHIKRVPYKGKVWSITTGRTNYLARRNGNVFVTGNSNVQIPYIQAAIETMVPRIVDARPDFTVLGRNEGDQMKAEKQQKLMDYFWEVAGMDSTTEDFVRSTLIYGTGFLQVSWKKDVRELSFLRSKDVANPKYVWKKEKRTFFDGPMCEWVDNYNLWYDWHNTARKSKQFWFKRLVLTEEEIRRRYPMADKKRLDMAIDSPGGDLVDYAAIRQQVRTTNIYTTKSSAATMMSASGTVYGTDKYYSTQSNTMKMYEVYEWWRPFEDFYAVMVGGSYVPIFKDGYMPIPMDFKEAPFIEASYLKIPGEFEGYGLPLILESPQIMLNLVKNQRLDAATLSIHKMWIVNPLANINKDELVTRPFGIIYSIDPNGVREIQFSDIKMSAYKEEELLKNDMQYASGVDDFSMGIGGGAGSATEVRHLRESTLERVRMFVNHLGDAYADVLRYWMDMTRQLFTETMTIRIIGTDGKQAFPLIEKDDFKGMFDYKATVLPSIAGQDEVKKKQDMDLYQLLISLPFIDPQKLTSRVISDWGWSLDGISKPDGQPQPAVGPDGQPLPQGAPAPGGAPAMPPPPGGAPPAGMPPMPQGAPPDGAGGPGFGSDLGFIPRSNLRSVVSHLRGAGETYDGPNTGSAYPQFSAPVDLLTGGVNPPTVQGVPPPSKSAPQGMPNIAGHNRKIGGKVDTNVSTGGNASVQSGVLNRTFSIQK